MDPGSSFMSLPINMRLTRHQHFVSYTGCNTEHANSQLWSIAKILQGRNTAEPAESRSCGFPISFTRSVHSKPSLQTYVIPHRLQYPLLCTEHNVEYPYSWHDCSTALLWLQMYWVPVLHSAAKCHQWFFHPSNGFHISYQNTQSAFAISS